jgi:hypothetical protein
MHNKTRWYLLAVALGAIVMALVYVPIFPNPPPSPDVDILMKVKQAGLWEMPVGAELAVRGQSPRVRDIGQRINNEHQELDEKTIVAAAATGVTLPTEPNADQKKWMAEISQASSDNIDYIAVNRLRAAHGKVLPLLTQVKVGTRNPVIRAFATDAMIYVGRHIAYLESTGLVAFDDLPEPVLTPSTDYVSYLGWGIVGAALLGWAYHRVYHHKRSTVPHHRRQR